MPEVNFNLLNPSAELYSAPEVKMDPVAAYEKAKATRQSNMLAELYAKHYDPQTGDVNYNALIPEAAQSGLDVSQLMPGLREQQESMASIAQKRALQQQEEAAANLHTIEAKQKEADAKHADISRAIGDIAKYRDKPAAMNGIEQKFEEGKIDKEAYDNLMNMVRNEPSWIKSQRSIINSLMSAKEQLETLQSQEPKPEKVDVGGSIKIIDMNPNSPTYMKEIKSLTKSATPRQEFTNERLSVSAKDYPNVAQAIVDGRLAPNRVNSRNASILENTLKLNPDFDLESATATAIGTEAGARTLGTVGANQAAAGNEAATMIPIARLYADKVGAGQFKSLNDLSNWASKHTGDKSIVQLNTSLNSLVNSYARAINPRGMPTVSDKNHAREILDAGLSNGQLNATLDVMEQEIDAARAGTAAARSEVNPGGKTPPAAGGGTKTPPPAAIDMLLKNPSTAAKFDQIFGAGASAKYLPKGK